MLLAEEHKDTRKTKQMMASKPCDLITFRTTTPSPCLALHYEDLGCGDDDDDDVDRDRVNANVEPSLLSRTAN